VKIVICEDDSLTTEQHLKTLEKVTLDLALTAEVQTVKSGEELLFAWEELAPIDLLLLDIQMPGMSGMELAKKIRKMDNRVQILFISNYADYVFDGYEVNAIGYTLKPLNQQELTKIVTKTELLLQEEPLFLMVQTESSLTKLYLYDILAIEAQGHYLVISCQKTTVRIKMPLVAIKEQLSPDFVQTHRSYLVNLNHISALQDTTVSLSNGEKVPVSRKQKKVVKELFLAHYRGLANE